MVKELKQLNDDAVPGKPVVISIEAYLLSEEDNMKLLDAVNILGKNAMVE